MSGIMQAVAAGSKQFIYSFLSNSDKSASYTVNTPYLIASKNTGSAGGVRGFTSMPVDTMHKYYWEATCTAGTVPILGVATAAWTLSQALGVSSAGWGYVGSSGVIQNGAALTTVATWAVNDVIGFAMDSDANTLEFFKNGVSQYVATGVTTNVFPAISSAAASSDTTFNFGASAFAYTPPAGFGPLGYYA